MRSAPPSSQELCILTLLAPFVLVYRAFENLRDPDRRSRRGGCVAGNGSPLVTADDPPVREFVRRLNTAPRPLPLKRPRRLSICETLIDAESFSDSVASSDSGAGAFDHGKTWDQLQSPLFRLPFEIREMIWKFAVGGNVVHITHLEKRLMHIVCDDTEDFGKADAVAHSCWVPESSYFDHCQLPMEMYYGPRRSKPLLQLGALNLLQVCRRAYSETINLLYTQNTFEIKHVYTIQDLKLTLLPQRFHSIHSLRFSWHISHVFFAREPGYYHPKEAFHRRAWEEAWEIIAGMKGLRSLEVELYGGHVFAGAQTVPFMPLLQVRHVPHFVVTIGGDFPVPAWEAGGGSFEGMPFVLRHRQRGLK